MCFSSIGTGSAMMPGSGFIAANFWPGSQAGMWNMPRLPMETLCGHGPTLKIWTVSLSAISWMRAGSFGMDRAAFMPRTNRLTICEARSASIILVAMLPHLLKFGRRWHPQFIRGAADLRGLGAPCHPRRCNGRGAKGRVGIINDRQLLCPVGRFFIGVLAFQGVKIVLI